MLICGAFLLALCERRKVTFKWVAGHTGNKENERCDRLSMDAAKRPNLPPDTSYEGESTHQDGLFA